MSRGDWTSPSVKTAGIRSKGHTGTSPAEAGLWVSTRKAHPKLGTWSLGRGEETQPTGLVVWLRVGARSKLNKRKGLLASRAKLQVGSRLQGRRN